MSEFVRGKIPRHKVLSVVEHLGFDPDNVLSIMMDYSGVTVVEFQRDEEGHRFLAGDGAALVTSVLAITDDYYL